MRLLGPPLPDQEPGEQDQVVGPERDPAPKALLEEAGRRLHESMALQQDGCRAPGLRTRIGRLGVRHRDAPPARQEPPGRALGQDRVRDGLGRQDDRVGVGLSELGEVHEQARGAGSRTGFPVPREQQTRLAQESLASGAAGTRGGPIKCFPGRIAVPDAEEVVDPAQDKRGRHVRSGPEVQELGGLAKPRRLLQDVGGPGDRRPATRGFQPRPGHERGEQAPRLVRPPAPQGRARAAEQVLALQGRSEGQQVARRAGSPEIPDLGQPGREHPQGGDESGATLEGPHLRGNEGRGRVEGGGEFAGLERGHGEPRARVVSGGAFEGRVGEQRHRQRDAGGESRKKRPPPTIRQGDLGRTTEHLDLARFRAGRDLEVAAPGW